MLALEHEWVWDSWYLHDGQRWHCWFLKAPKALKDPELRHWNVTQGHATSADLRSWDYQGEAFAPAPGPAWDDYTTWTGSALRGDDDRWHYFYTGTSRADDGKIQRIGHAVGDDLASWERVGDGLCLDLAGPNATHYETAWEGRWHDRAMRDPWVMKNPDGPGWLMFFTARAPAPREVMDAGCIGFATSPDLYRWELQPPAFVGGWGQLEVPQVFSAQGSWYCLFCMSEEHQHPANKERHGPSGYGNHYLVAASPSGPWRLPEARPLDVAKDRYAARIVDDRGLKIIGFKDGGRERFGGYIMDPEPVGVNGDNLLVLGG